MKLLVVGPDGPGSLLRSLEGGLRTKHELVVTDILAAASSNVDRSGPVALFRRRLSVRTAGPRLLEAVRQLEPDVVLLIKGRGVDTETIRTARRTGARFACYFPDNPFWRGGDGDALCRLSEVDLAILWSDRVARLVKPHRAKVEVVPFGYDDDWFPVRSPTSRRAGVVFLGTWSARRERYLSALEGLPLTVRGHGWEGRPIAFGGPTYEAQAGGLLGSAAVGVNLLHPQCAGAHNMRTREIAASGAAQVTEPGTDGTPLREDDSCAWFQSPAELRGAVVAMLADPDRAVALATRAQRLVQVDTYDSRGAEIAQLIDGLA